MNPSAKLMKALSDEMRGMLCILKKSGELNCSVDDAMRVLGETSVSVVKKSKGQSVTTLRKKILTVNENCILKDDLSVSELREILKKEKATVAEQKKAAKKLEAEARKAQKAEAVQEKQQKKKLTEKQQKS